MFLYILEAVTITMLHIALKTYYYTQLQNSDVSGASITPPVIFVSE